MINNVLSISNIPTIAIIGGGFSGSLIATHLLRNATQPLKIKLIERNGEFGKGIAYSTKENTDLLNVPAGKMSAFPDDADHLLRWLESNSTTLQHLLPPRISHDTFIPRQVYGLYIQSVLTEAQNSCTNHIYLEKLNHEAISMEKTNQGVLISLNNNQHFPADKVILAIGNSLSNPSQSNNNYSCNGWSSSALDNIDSNADILLVGTGLTMVDIVTSLHSRNHQGKIYALSRRGLFPQSHKKSTPYPPFFKLENAPLNILKLFKLIRHEVKKGHALGYNWRSIIDSLCSITQQLWQKLPKTEQKRFLRHVTPYWDIHRHRMAPSVGEIIHAKLKSGQLTINAGRIKGYQLQENKTKVIIRPRYQEQNTVILVDRVINCTGIPADYRNSNHPLIKDLQAQGLIRANILGLGLDSNANGQIISANGEISSFLYLIGTPRKGDLWETIAVPELRHQAKSLAEKILTDLPLQVRPLPSQPTPVFPQSNDIKTNTLLFRQFFDPETSSYTYLIADSVTQEAVLVDSVLEQVDRDLEVLDELGLKLVYCLETHLHADHITGAGKLRQITGCKVIVPYNPVVTKADRSLSGGETLQIGSVSIETITTPGHTASHITYLVNKTHLLTGDALFIRGCGRTDFQGGDSGTLYDVVTEKLFTLPNKTLVYPAHDYKGRTVSTIGEEKSLNPRFVDRTREEFITIMSNLNLSYPKKMDSAVPANEYCGDFISQDSIINNINLAQEEKEKIAETVDKNTEIYNDYFAMYI
jgi:uncharacterized NAD(P)/FAD-binding protein YdhS/glyoxylase-like metal-dependent hydrolase (beta-lactamase superfamily II)